MKDSPSSREAADSSQIESRLQVWLEWAVGRGLHVVGAESLTAGAVSHFITNVPGASKVFLGGFVTYSHDFKVGAIGVQRDLIANQGAVDPEVAAQMALGARASATRFTGLAPEQLISFATTGVAGPATSDGKPVGLVYVAVASHMGEIQVREFRFSGGRSQIRLRATLATIEFLMEQS